ncbi:MAG: hypothetical protein ACR2OH_00550, partial [Microthrixaceae bacterium]
TLPTRSDEGRLRRLTELLDAQGYLADIKRTASGHYRINLHSCATWGVANRFRQVCDAELQLLNDLMPRARIERVAHKTACAHTCVYEVELSRCGAEEPVGGNDPAQPGSGWSE